MIAHAAFRKDYYTVLLDRSISSALFLCFGIFPPTAVIEDQTDPEGGEPRQRVAQPEAVVLHVQSQTEEEGQHAEHRAADRQETAHSTHKGPRPFRLSGADVPCDENLTGRGEAYGHKGRQIGDIAAFPILSPP